MFATISLNDSLKAFCIALLKAWGEKPSTDDTPVNYKTENSFKTFFYAYIFTLIKLVVVISNVFKCIVIFNCVIYWYS